ncbi:MAG: tetratricopeptide repeat protein [Ignavibacteria bacterium]|nr:tetratricopeptide repeat protein [Ignavibacteria bacterium]
MFKVLLSIVMIFITLQKINAQEMTPEVFSLFNAGKYLFNQGKYKEAIDSFQAALKLDKHFQIYYELGLTYKKNNQLKEALKSFNESVTINPKFDLAYNQIAFIHFTDKKYEEALKYFQKYSELASDSLQKEQANKNISTCYIRLADASTKAKNNDKAVSYLKKSLEYNDKNDAAYAQLAKIYVETKKYNEALTSADNGLKYRATIPKGLFYYYKGVALKNLNKLSEARAAFEEGKKDPAYKAVCESELNSLPKK